MRRRFIYTIYKTCKVLGLLLVIAFFGLQASAQISLTATAGTMGPTLYTTLGGAFNAINAGTHQGIINISVTASTTETVTAVLNQSGAPSNYTSVTIKPAPGVTATINSAIANAGPIQLNGASFVTIDGSNTVGGTSHDLTITNTDPNSFYAISMTDPNAFVSFSADKIVNCIITGAGGSAGFNSGFGIISGRIVLPQVTLNLASNTDNSVQNNIISGWVQGGVVVLGSNSLDASWNVTGNTMTDCGFTGVTIWFAQNSTVSYNNISNNILNGGGPVTGVELMYTINGANVFGNQISGTTNTVNYGAYGIYLSCNANANVNVYNNFVANTVSASGPTQARTGHGIFMDGNQGSSPVNIFFNSVNQSVNQTGLVATASANGSAALCFAPAVAGSFFANSVNVVDNILVNTETNLVPRYGIYCSAPVNIFGTIDYNDYYATSGNLGRILNVNRTTIPMIQAGFGQNVNSITYNATPVWTSSTDLHLTAVGSLAAGIPITTPFSITTDIDVQTRNATTPDMGADEFNSCVLPAITAPVTTVCPGATIILSDAAVGGTWSSATTGVATVVTGPGSTTTVTGVSPTGGTSVITYSTGPGCSVSITITVLAAPAAITGTTTLCTGSTTQLSNSVAGTWTSGTSSVATITPGGGLVSGVTTGTSTIKFTSSSTGCTTTTTATVISPPGAISGATTVCPGSTIVLSNATAGGTWSSATTTVATVTPGPSSTTTVTGVATSGGTSVITYSTGAGCSSNVTITVIASPPPISGSTTVCAGSTTQLSNSVAGTWSSATSSVATITPTGGLASGVTTGTSIITFTSTATGCIDTTLLTVTSAPSTISGNVPLCPGTTITLSNSVAGGTWTSATTTVATVVTGPSPTTTVTGVSGLGTSVITYSLGSGCSKTVTVTVNALPAAIVGTFTICPTATTQLSNSVAGTWTSATSSVATVTPAGGLVGGGSPGTSVITFTSSATGCIATATVTVNSVPGVISGPTSVCAGTSITLSNAVAGGTWTSATTTVATVTPGPGAGGGVVSGVPLAQGTSVITYSNGCSSPAITVTVVATPLPISGTPAVCVGLITNLSDASTGGTWSSATSSVATVTPGPGTGGGAVGGGSGGTAVISYSNGCGTPVQVTVTVTPFPTAITGATSLCLGTTTTLSNGTAGGTWTSSNSSIAGIGSSSGFVSGNNNGTVTITYANTCGSATAPLTVTSPTAITGITTFCQNATTTLSNGVGGGTWSSSNPAVATTTGIVNDGTIYGSGLGSSPGTSVITYTIAGGCFVTATITTTSAPTAITGLFSICAGSVTNLTDGVTGGAWSSPNTNVTVSGSGAVTGNSAGSAVISYTIGTCAATAVVSVNPLPTAITGPLSLCVNATITLSDATPSGNWSSSTSSVATIDPGSGVVSGVSAGVSMITYTLSSGCFITRSVTVNAIPLPITGNLNICASTTTTLSDATGSGTWSSSLTTVATINSGTGVVSAQPGVGGTTTITYTSSVSGCYTTTVVTVSPLPSPIIGNTTICTGTSTTLTATPSGGAWSSSNSLVASVDVNGVLTGGTLPGTVLISYSLGSGCTSTATITVNQMPVAIAGGPATICAGLTTTLSDATGGGTWTSSTTAVAIGSLSGIVTGNSAGTSVITYNRAGCAVTTSVTVNPLPGTILGITSICVGLTTALTDNPSGGTWSSSNTNTTIDVNTGVATGQTAGTSTITYTLPTGCIRTILLTVNPLPVAISGNTTICAGLTATLSDATGGGTWSSSNTLVATIGTASGIVTAGTVTVTSTTTITYTLVTGCTSTTVVTVNPLPLPITGSTTICVNAITTLSDATAGGTWSSATSSVATITPGPGAGGGIVSGGNSGTSKITYTLIATGCTATTNVTVNPLPTVIGGITTICGGQTTTLSDGTGGGTWSSNTTAISITAGPGITGGVITGSLVGSQSTATVTYTVGSGCFITTVVTVNPLPGPITGNTTICAGLTTTLSDATSSGTWSSGTSTVATINSNTGFVTGGNVNIQSTSRITYTLIATGCTATANVTVNPLPSPIGGLSTVCEGSTINLSEAATTGTWSTSNSTVATVVPAAAFGQVTGGSTGGALSAQDTITYTLGTGCIATKTITVTIQPTAIINGPQNICDHSSVFLSDAIATGVWTSSNTLIATVDPATGLVTGSIPGAGVGGGIATIIYRIGNCSVSTSVFVNPQPVAITGTTSVCSGAFVTLSDATPGGGWSTSNSTVATVVPSAGGGKVTGGINPGGTALITYSIPNATGSCIATTSVTVNLQPSPISGITSLCNTAVTSLSDTVAGGLWSSSNTLIATVDPNTGMVTGTGTGSVLITYKIGNCSASITVTINTQPGPISGNMQICNGFTTQLSDIAGGGVWSVNPSSVAVISVNSSGLVSGLSAGTGIVTHTLGSCFATATVTVNALPSVMTGAFFVCAGSQTTLGDLSTPGTWSSSNGSVATVGVNTGIVSGVSTGVTTITYTILAGCITTHSLTVIAAPAAISPASNNVCTGQTIQLSDLTNGGDWSTSNTNTATIGSSSGIVTGVSPGTVVVSYTLGSGCRVVAAVVVNPLSPITGITTVCIGQTTNLSDTTIGGIWSSINSSVATVNPVTGVVYGHTAGTAVIIYNLSTGCSATTTVTVLPLPLPITGVTSVCLGQTTMLSDASPGGVWSSNDPSIAGIDPSSGLVTGNVAGSVVITYTQGGCPQTTIVTVNPLTAPIIGNTDICLGLTSALSDATPGGVWTSSNTLVATIDPSSGLVTSVAVGSTTIVYAPATGCVESVLVTVNPLPASITGITTICVGSCTQLSDAPPGGAWFSNNPSIATIGFVNGLLCGVSAGTTTITYQIVTGCIMTTTVLVNPLPLSISGSSSVCVGATTSLFSGPGTGVWTSSNTNIATVDPSGVVTGVAPGSTTISFTLGTGCASTLLMTVNPNPAPITGINTVCIGLSTQLFDATSGGTWSSANPIIAYVDPSNNGVIYGGSSVGATTITYTLGTSCYVTTPMTVNNPPVAITGPTQVCAGSQITLFDVGVPGGAWTSSNTAAATIDPLSGIVTGVAQGTTIITYTMGGGSCFMTHIVTVNPLPLPITGITQVCAGLTTTLSDASAGGTWSSLSPGVATIDPNSGVVYAVGGSTTLTTLIVYTLPTTCSTTTLVTVNPLPAPITGNHNVCYQNTTTLSDSPSPGIWSSANPAVASVDPNTGVVTGNSYTISGGVTTITYTYVPTGCIMTTTVAVHPLPAVFNVSGGGTYCAGTGGVHIFLSGSEIGVNYFLYLGGTTPAGTFLGTGAPLDFGLQVPAGVYTAVATNMFTTCSINMTGSATVIVTPSVTPTVSITANPGDTVCAGTLVNYTTISTNGGTSPGPSYQWSVNGLNVSTVSSYNFVPANGDVVKVIMTSGAVCANPLTATDTLKMTVLTPIRPSVGILVSPSDTVCLGTAITLTAIPSFGGASPTYQWLVDGLPVATSQVYTYVPADGDVVFVDMTSNYQCRLATTVQSNTQTIKVDSPVIPVVTIVGSQGSIITIGQSDTLQAIVTNGVGATYQWFLNGIPVPGATNQTYISNNFHYPRFDSIGCQVTNAGACREQTFGWTYIQVYPLGVTQVSGNMSDLNVIPNPNKGAFTIKGTLGTTNDEEVTIELTDVLGQVIYKDKVLVRGGKMDQQVTVGTTLANGMYMLNVNSDTEHKVFHVVIEQ